MKSIIQDEHDTGCYLCGYKGNLEKHHVWHGSANRKLAEEDGLFVYLCRTCHTLLHDKGRHDKNLMIEGEKRWCSIYKKTKDEFRERYGKNLI